MSAAASARQILTQLHEVMAGRHHAQHKLDRVVDIIAESLTSEVCSIYLLRDGELELYATHGLNPDAVHVTRMGVGEGLTGTIAKNIETLNLAEAKAHPDFLYRPETGEDKFHSFAGVPIVYRERAVGVLCVQHVEPRRYEDVEIEALQTTAMVFMIAIGALILNNFIALAGISSGVINWIESLHLEPFAVLLVILAFYVALGTVVEGLAMIFLTVPIFVPVIESLGFDLIWFGIVLVMMTEISLITPPIGLNVFVMKSMMPGVPLNAIFRGIVPFFCADIVRLSVVVAFPSVALWLPKLVYGPF